MRKSKLVKVWMVSAVAAALATSGCVSGGYRTSAQNDEDGSAESLRCVEKDTNKVVDEKQCDDERVRRGGIGYPFLWYYGGFGGRRFGSIATGGGYNAVDGANYRTASGTTRVGTAGGVSRGGFGRTGGGGFGSGGSRIGG